ncbi:MAG: AAA family ATPase [Planctomycetes bacterium]|nr:AAA family ATPase [Planctomycetota bacterium]
MDVLAVQHPPLPWIIDGILVRGAVGWIAGPPKTYKSWIGLHACLCLASGAPFLGRYATTLGRALYLSEEDPERIAYRRVQRLWHGLGRPPEAGRFRIACHAGFRLDKPECLDWLLGYLREWPADLVLLDVFNRLHSADLKDSAAMTGLLAGIDRLRRETGAAFLTVAHFRKAQANQANDVGGAMLAGSVSLHGFSEASLYLSKPE